ncbi:MAG: outer membrane lipoprotein-sorting protein [Verrucomicrobiota bacterium]
MKTPDQAEGTDILGQMRQALMAEDTYLEFELKVLPRRGEEILSEGRLWASQNSEGPVMRLSLGEGTLLVQSGPNPMAWRWSSLAQREPAVMDVATWFAPLADSDLSAFDLQMPFLFWEDWVYEGQGMVGGRTADTFFVKPPPSVATQRPELTAIRFHLDRTYHAILLAEHIGKDSAVTKTFRLIGLKRVGDRYTMKAVEIRDELTRRKTRLTVTEARIGDQLPAVMFKPEYLDRAPSKPARADN